MKKKTRSKPRSPRRSCACGCGKTFTPTKAYHRFATDACRAAAWNKAHQRQPDELEELNRRIDRLEAQLKKRPGKAL